MSQASRDARSTKHMPAATTDSLLRTKLFVPVARSKQVSRPRLLQKLNGGLDKALILVSAPAGYGKTTLVSSWLREIGIPSAWLSLDDQDNEPRRFLQYLAAAIQKVVPAVPSDAVQMLQGASPAAIEALLTALINEITTQSRPVLLVMDDLHVIHAQPVLEALGFLLEHIPPELHLVLLSRSDVPLPLARMRARNQILDVRAEHMRFDAQEAAMFLRDVMELGVSAEDIAMIEARTEGWIAGLQLAALSLRGSKDAHGFVAEFARRQDYIVDYLVEEVLNRQPENVRAFLLQTSGLGRMCGALCEAVLEPGGGKGSAGQDMLEALDQMNLFIMPLDEERQWYRYHHLFADVLHKRMTQVDRSLTLRLEARAAAWYETNGYLPEAIHHCIAAGDIENAARLIEQNGCMLIIRGEVLTLKSWLDAVEISTGHRPWFSVYRGWIAALTGNADRVEEHLRQAEELAAAQPAGTDTSTLLGSIMAARAYHANLQGHVEPAAGFARQALTDFTATDPTTCSLRVVAISLLGDASAIRGDLDVAWDAYNEAARVIRSVGDVHLNIVLNSNLANILAGKGQLRGAAELHRETLRMAALPDGRTAPIGGRACVELSQLCYEWNDLDESAEHVEKGLALCRPWGNRETEAVGLVVQARLSAIRGEMKDACQSMQDAEQLVTNYRLGPINSAWVRSALARLWLAQGEISKVTKLVAESGVTTDGEITYLREPEFITLVRLMISQGEYEAALRLAGRMRAQTEAAGRNGRLIELLVLQALALQGEGKTDGALACLGKALSLARPERYVRSFLDEGEGLVKLLYLAKTRDFEGAYAAELLGGARESNKAQLPAQQLLLQPLTVREIEVLKLIDGGSSNQEIAAQLYISLATVKRHISNIYTKLDVRGRTQALSRSRELGLLG
jgi:ATP/maltotriose-dependent transcriptional regulator MalT